MRSTRIERSRRVRSDPLWSMATLRKNRTGLPVNIWVDEGDGSKQGRHGKRLKFQINRGDNPIPRNFASMTISNNPRVIGKHTLSGQDIHAIQNFVLMNKEALEALVDQKIDIEDFLQVNKED